MKTAEDIKAAHELLGKVEGLRNYVQRCCAAGRIEQPQYVALMQPIQDLNNVTRRIVSAKESQHERAGGVFNQPVNPKVEIRRNVYRS